MKLCRRQEKKDDGNASGLSTKLWGRAESVPSLVGLGQLRKSRNTSLPFWVSDLMLYRLICGASSGSKGADWSAGVLWQSCVNKTFSVSTRLLHIHTQAHATYNMKYDRRCLRELLLPQVVSRHIYFYLPSFSMRAHMLPGSSCITRLDV